MTPRICFSYFMDGSLYAHHDDIREFNYFATLIASLRLQPAERITLLSALACHIYAALTHAMKPGINSARSLAYNGPISQSYLRCDYRLHYR
jgi:hypothetical protein